MEKQRKAFWFAGIGIAAVALLILFYLGGAIWNTAAGKVNILFNTAAAWFAFVGFALTANAESGPSRRPWTILAVGIGILAGGESAVSYLILIIEKLPGSVPFAVNAASLAAYVLIAIALVIKARALPRTPWSASKIIVMAAVALAFFAYFFFDARLILRARVIPPLVCWVMVLFTLADFAIVASALFVVVTFGRGVVGRPWAAVAFGALLLAVSDLLHFLGAHHAPEAPIIEIAAVAQFVSYASFSWGAWYHRALLRDL
jgi:hypothetical protein